MCQVELRVEQLVNSLLFVPFFSRRAANFQLFKGDLCFHLGSNQGFFTC